MNVFNWPRWRNINRSRLKDALVALSFAHLVFLRILLVLLDHEIAVYQAREPHNRNDYRAALLDIFVLAGLLYAGLRFLRGIASPRIRGAARFLGLAALVFPFEQVRVLFKIPLIKLLLVGKPLLAVAGLAFGLVVFVYARALSRLAYRVCLGLVLTTALTLPRAAWWAVEGNPERPQPAPLFSKKAAPAMRVAWIVFDEWDERVTFDARPQATRLPNIDAMIRTAVTATNAYPPAGNTPQSIPSLLLGRYLQSIQTTAEGGLRTQTFGSTNWEDFAPDSHLVNLALSAGLRVGVAGWFQPYSRLFGSHPDLWTFWMPMPPMLGFSRGDVLSGCGAQFRFAFNPRGAVIEQSRAVQLLRGISSDLLQNSNVDLVYLHLPIPHVPGVYNPKTGKYDVWWVQPGEEYFNNLALADRVLGEFRSDLSRSGLAARTALVLSSDHWWRESATYDHRLDHRVPFMVQLPGFSEARTFGRPINTVMTKDLVLSLLKGAVTTPDQVVAFMQSRIQSKPTTFHGPDNYGVPEE